MEVDRVAESDLVSESASAYFHHLDPAVDALGMAVMHIQNDGIDDAPEMVKNRRRHLLHQLQSTAQSPA